jgi:hypothetical protein
MVGHALMIEHLAESESVEKTDAIAAICLDAGYHGAASAAEPMETKVQMSLVDTFRKWLAVRLESAMRFEADIGEMNIAACSSR